MEKPDKYSLITLVKISIKKKLMEYRKEILPTYAGSCA